MNGSWPHGVLLSKTFVWRIDTSNVVFVEDHIQDKYIPGSTVAPMVPSVVEWSGWRSGEGPE